MGMTIAVQPLPGVVASISVGNDAPRQTNVSRTKRRISTPLAPGIALTTGLMTASLVTLMLMAPVSATYAQDTAPAAGQTGTNSQTAATGAGATHGSQPAAASQAAGPQSPADQGQSAGSPSTGSTGDTSRTGGGQPEGAKGKSAAVCFKLTGHCVEGSKGPAAKGSAASAAKDGSSVQRPLNLSAPDVRTVVSAAELKEPLPSDGQITETQEAETVSVKGESGVPPDVPGGFGALWWALNHPSQAWRILAPAE
jgi:hypothetical protein